MKLKPLMLAVIFTFSAMSVFGIGNSENNQATIESCPNSIQVRLSCGAEYDYCNFYPMTILSLQVFLADYFESEELYCTPPPPPCCLT